MIGRVPVAVPFHLLGLDPSIINGLQFFFRGPPIIQNAESSQSRDCDVGPLGCPIQSGRWCLGLLVYLSQFQAIEEEILHLRGLHRLT